MYMQGVDARDVVKEAVNEFNKDKKNVKALIIKTDYLEYSDLGVKNVNAYTVAIKSKLDYFKEDLRLTVFVPLDYKNTLYIRYDLEDIKIEYTCKEEAKSKIKEHMEKLYSWYKHKVDLPEELINLLEKLAEIVKDFEFYVTFDTYYNSLQMRVGINNFDTLVIIKIGNMHGKWDIMWATISGRWRDHKSIKDAIKNFLEFNNIKCKEYEYSICIDLTNLDISRKLDVVRKIVEAATIPYLI